MHKMSWQDEIKLMNDRFAKERKNRNYDKPRKKVAPVKNPEKKPEKE